MLVLAIDTATSAVTAGIVELGGDTDVAQLVVRRAVGSRGHAETLTPQILECLAELGSRPTDLGAVVTGAGPGPFTGLRVGMATAAAFGDALDVPVYGVCSHDAIASDVAVRRQLGETELLVVTDARRREIYWARYRSGERVEGPGVCSPAALDIGAAGVIAGSARHVDYFDLPVEPIESPSPAGLVRAVAPAILAGVQPDPLEPLYLRRPDAVARQA